MTDHKALLPVLEDLANAVEDLVSTGLTTATKATLERLDVSFKEASRLKLGRLAASLKYSNDEVARHLSESPDFSARRLSLFLNRSWVLAMGLSHAIATDDEASVKRLLWAATPEKLERVEVVTLGVRKRVTRSGPAAFDFHLREVGTGKPFVWSVLFNRRDSKILAEGYLHLPQPQQFKPRVFLEGKVLVIENAARLPAAHGPDRILMGPKSTVTEGDAFTEWGALYTWDRASVAARVQAHEPGPLDLEIELQEEVILEDWRAEGLVDRGRDGQMVWPLQAGDLTVDVVVSTVPEEGRELKTAFEALRKKKKKGPPLYGLLHVDLCRLVFQPLATLGPKGPTPLMLSDEKIDVRALMKTLTF